MSMLPPMDESSIGYAAWMEYAAMMSSEPKPPLAFRGHCPTCDVQWSTSEGSLCWVCGEDVAA